MNVRPFSAVTRLLLVVCVAALFLVACSGPVVEPTATPSPTPLPTATPPPTPTLVPSPTPIPRKTIWVDPVLPTDIHDTLMVSFTAFAQGASDPTLTVEVTTTQPASVKVAADAEGTPFITRTYALAAPFPTLADGITLDAFRKFWAGDATALTSLSADGVTTPTLFLDPNTRAALVLLLGRPAETLNIQMVRAEDLLATTWATRAASFAVLPFEQLEARWKLLTLDGINLFEREADMTKYPLTLVVRAQGDTELLREMSQQIAATDNRDLSKMTIVAMTGVTAMVRGTGFRMEEKGITYPAQKIRDWLVTADVTHISNEVSFWDQCPPPTFNSGLRMCSSPRYMELLTYVGTDVVELTGNHTWDYGAQRIPGTLDLYDQAGMKYFGGGRDLTAALTPLTMTVNGNRIAFIGCNYFGVNWANAEYPGSAPCSPGEGREKDLTYQVETIQRLKAEGYNVIATLQYEEYYFYQSTPQQRRDFGALREAGAVVVNGSQGHHAQGFDVNGTGFIAWGTGNIFFGDQDVLGAKQTMVHRHVFYDNKYLGVDIRTALIEDESQPVPMTPEARAALLRELFDVSRFQ
jgi:poly-gamma-glutamate synthesis protein (capsule biosynthesis protein)